MKAKAVVWLHFLRLWRYKISFMNTVLNTVLWFTIFLLGALMFVPRDQLAESAALAFWGIVMWNLISTPTWVMGGWMRFYVSQGFVEEHMLADTSTAMVLVGRMIPNTAVSTAASALMYYVVSAAAGQPLPPVRSWPTLVLGLADLMAMAVAYSLTIAAATMVTGAPMRLVELGNFLVFIVGGIAAPVGKLPTVLQKVALVIPYSYASETARLGAAGIPPHTPHAPEASTAIAIAMMVAALASMKRAERVVRKRGTKAIGGM